MKYFVQVMAKYDTNKDGVLTGEEWKTAGAGVDAADADKDGRITPQEYGLWKKKN